MANSNAQGLPIVLSAPSGGGKTTIAEQVIKALPAAVRSISCTTRAPRSHEKEGVDYYFLNKDEFKKRIDAGDFMEWATVHDNYYGTPLSSFTQRLNEGKDVFLVIDPQGAVAVRKKYPQGIFIFIVPPTWDMLLKRLKERGTDNAAQLDVRLTNARREIENLSSYDYLVLNETLDTAVNDVLSILKAERCRLQRVDKKAIPIFN